MYSKAWCNFPRRRERGRDIGKELSEMTLEELWELFPIFLVEHNDEWDSRYDEMEARLRHVLSECPVKRISHVGSTAIPRIWAKDIVDILVEVSGEADLEAVAHAIEGGGFLRMSEGRDKMSFNCGYTEDGFAEKVFHVHLRRSGDNDELYFRDYLREHPQIAREYEALKLDLWRRFEYDRDGYTETKTEFVRKWTDEAKEDYEGRYS